MKFFWGRHKGDEQNDVTVQKTYYKNKRDDGVWVC